MISAIVLTKDSLKTLRDTLQSLKFCNQIIIVDDYSTDNTLKIAKRFKAKIFKRKLNGDYAAQRNYGLSKAKHEWVLFIDSDETISKSLAKEIQRKVGNNTFNGYYIKRRDYWLGKNIRYGETNINLLRLARKNKGKWLRKVHERWNIKGEIGTLYNPIKHYPHKSVRAFIESINRYSQIHFLQNKKEKKKSSISKLLFFPLLKIKYDYLFKKGYKDGVHGFVIAGIMGFHSFLSWSNLWLISRKK